MACTKIKRSNNYWTDRSNFNPKKLLKLEINFTDFQFHFFLIESPQNIIVLKNLNEEEIELKITRIIA